MKQFHMLRIASLFAMLVAGPALYALPNSFTSCDDCDCKATGKTTFMLKPSFAFNSPERLAHFRDRMKTRQDGWGGFFGATVYGGKATNEDRITQYFMPKCKTKLVIREQISPIDTEFESTTDIYANHLNIYTVNGDFESEVTFDPYMSFVGLGLTWKQEFAQREDGRALWFAFNGPIERIRTSMGMSEDIKNDGGGANPAFEAFNVVSNAEEGFQREELGCGKIDGCCKRDKTKFAFLEMVLGMEGVKTDSCLWETYIGLVAPTGNHQSAEYMFSPVVGYARHWGIMWGNSVAMELWHHECADSILMGYLDFNGQYMFKKCERRLVDAKCKPFSRYMQLYGSQEDAETAFNACGEGPDFNQGVGLVSHTPASQRFCLDLNIRPRYSFTWNGALVYRRCNFEGEIGINGYFRKAECATLGCDFEETAAFKSLLGCGQTDDVQQIDKVFGNANVTSFANYERNIIKAADLDLESASAPAMITHTVYASIARRSDDRNYPLVMGFGGSYDFASDNTGIDHWTLWAKLGVSF